MVFWVDILHNMIFFSLKLKTGRVMPVPHWQLNADGRLSDRVMFRTTNLQCLSETRYTLHNMPKSLSWGRAIHDRTMLNSRAWNSPLQFLWIAGWHPQSTWLVPLGYTLCPATQNVLALQDNIYITLCHRVFLIFQKPYTESISLFASVFPSRFVFVCFYRVLSKALPLSYLSPAGGPGGEFLASCTLSVIHMNLNWYV